MAGKNPVLIFSAVLLLLLHLIPSESNCLKSCGRNHSPRDFPYPFGFSSGCKIRLNCSSDGSAMIGDFPVHSITSDHIKLIMETKCNRRISAIRHFFSPHYAPTSHNAILLQNCTLPAATCRLPTTAVETKFESPNCSLSSSSISCYTQSALAGDFLDLKNLTATRCDYLLSAISSETMNSSAGVALEVQTVELGWWMEGGCRSCSGDGAICTELVSPSTGKPAYRCRCPEGMVGDGYVAGTGCRRASSTCHTMKYIYGGCGRTRIGILIGGVGGGAVALAGLFLFCRFIRRRSKLQARHVTQRRLSEAAGNCPIPIYTYREIEKATNNFSDKQRLGTGAYGTVYAGKFAGGELVAIKRLKNRDTDSIEQVMNEIKLISSVNHPNLVRLLGCSMESGEQILAYEFMANGTLSEHLQRERGDGLSWPERLNIAVDTANAIAHLHTALNPPIFHRDIKSSNILLDQNFKSKVADFGLSRLGTPETSHVSTAPQGTPGYLDPQYHQDFHLSDKSDVYSFGVVLVEIITGRKAVDFSRPREEVNLAALAADRIAGGRLREIMDPLMEMREDRTVEKVAEVAFRCLAFHRDMRPAMVEVATELEEIRRSRWESGGKVVRNSMGKEGLEFKELYLVESESSKWSNGGDEFSPVSVEDEDPWRSEQSSPSTSSLLNNVIL